MGDIDRRAALTAAGGALLAGGAWSQASARQASTGEDGLAGKVVAVTGATSGIGRATAELFAARGARVAFNGRRAQLGAEVERGIRAGGGEARYIQADVREEDQVRRFFRRTAELYGGLDIAVNNAGIQTVNEVDRATPAEFDDMMATNVRGVWLCVREEVALMRARGGGSIINIASIHAFASRPRLSAYSATKGAIMALTRSLALELGEAGIRVNAICPGPVDTAMLRGFATTPERRAEIAAGVYGLKRLGEPREVAEMIAGLASGGASFVTGAALVVDGGTLASI